MIAMPEGFRPFEAGGLKLAPGWAQCTLHRAAEVPAAVAAVLGQMPRHPFSASDGFAVQLALTEALDNALQHGNRGDPRKSVQLAFRVDPTEVALDIQDEGPGFALDSVLDPREAVGISNPRGRGIFLMRAYMTSVEYLSGGRRVWLQRVRGQGPAVAGPPPGYDFQI
jgi:serine/threonine-protein kinase RsbW